MTSYIVTTTLGTRGFFSRGGWKWRPKAAGTAGAAKSREKPLAQSDLIHRAR